MTINREFIRAGFLDFGAKKVWERFLDTWDSVVETISASLTGLTATAAELNLLDLSDQSETIAQGGVVSVTKRVTTLTQTGAGAITLAAPPASMLGQVKVIEQLNGGIDAVTLALTNVDGGSAATTATFDATGEALTLVAGHSKWHVVGEAGVTLV